jgi:hypothetical protein
LEHVSDVHGVLGKIRRLLKREGLLFIEVPNCNDEYYSLDTGDIPHIHFFTKESLCGLLDQHGFKTLTVDEYGLTCSDDLKIRLDRNHTCKELLQEKHISIKENIPRKDGNCLRALFQLSE